ncbi:hypothetical protein MP228_004688 [Amoeboaphelidium protococcarum]|nr:hypothetical protein MP228_004688 [Amoeboaphelidium protococcarum]
MNIFTRCGQQQQVSLISQIRWATKKTGSSKARQKRSPEGKRLGLKVYDGEPVKNGGIIVRQHGTKNHPGINVGMGRDFSIYALMDGYVQITRDPLKANKKYINVVKEKPEHSTMQHNERVMHTLEYKSPISEGYNYSVVQSRCSITGKRTLKVTNLNLVNDGKPAESWELSAYEFDPMAALIKASGLSKDQLISKIGNQESFNFADRFEEARCALGDLNIKSPAADTKQD